MCFSCSSFFSSILKMRSSCINLTFVKVSKERSIIFPTVSVSCFWDLNMINNKIRLSVYFKSYHSQLYTATPISLLYENRNEIIFNIHSIFSNFIRKNNLKKKQLFTGNIIYHCYKYYLVTNLIVQIFSSVAKYKRFEICYSKK